jgi:hypothetical protein
LSLPPHHRERVALDPLEVRAKGWVSPGLATRPADILDAMSVTTGTCRVCAEVSDGIPHEIPQFPEPVEFGASEGPIAFVCLGCEERQARGEAALVAGQHVFLTVDDMWVDARFERAGEPAEAEMVEHAAVTAGSHGRDVAIVRRYDTGEIDFVPYARVKVRRPSGAPG